ncbi:MAG TPA: M24 family metallopeptidase [Acidimicrobiia bacterium]|nr:M24 family metallopeptidase [Acidimicrobiia bacterium]
MAEGLTRALDEMARRDVDVLVLGREGNARFVSEATRLWLAGTRPFAPGCVVVRGTGAVHLMSVTDAGVPAAIPPEQLYPMSWNPANIVGAVAAIPGVSGARRIGVDGLTPLFEQLFAATLPDAELTDGEVVMRAARRVKSPDQVAHLRAAIALAEDAFGAAVAALRPGVRESDLKGVFEERMGRLGTTTPAFEGVFCVVDGGAPLRRFVSDRTLADGDLVAMSAGVLLDGWEGSLIRTWPAGTPAPGHRERLSRWQAEWTRALDRCRAGVAVGELRTAPGVSLHGVGLGYEGIEDAAVLEPGMTVQMTLDAAGVVGGDVLLVGDGDADVLTAFPYGPAGE